MGRHKKTDKEENKFQAPNLNLSSETKRGIAVVVFVVLALIVVLSLADLAGSLGQGLFKILTITFGLMTYAVPLILLSVAISLYKQDLEAAGRSNSFYWRIYLGALILTGSIGGLIHMFYLSNDVSGFSLASEGRGGGYVGAVFAQPAFRYLGFWAGSLVLFALIVIGILITFDISLKALWPVKENEEEELRHGRIDGRRAAGRRRRCRSP